MRWVREEHHCRFPLPASGDDEMRAFPSRTGETREFRIRMTIPRNVPFGTTARRGKLRFPLLGRSKADRPSDDAPVAQPEEQWVSNPLVGGSSPSGRASFEETTCA